VAEASSASAPGSAGGSPSKGTDAAASSTSSPPSASAAADTPSSSPAHAKQDSWGDGYSDSWGGGLDGSLGAASPLLADNPLLGDIDAPSFEHGFGTGAGGSSMGSRSAYGVNGAKPVGSYVSPYNKSPTRGGGGGGAAKLKSAMAAKAAAKTLAVKAKTRGHHDNVAARRKAAEDARLDAHRSAEVKRSDDQERMRRAAQQRMQKGKSARQMQDQRRAHAALAAGSGRSGAGHGLHVEYDIQEALEKGRDVTGLKVRVEAGGGQRQGTVRFCGKTYFSEVSTALLMRRALSAFCSAPHADQLCCPLCCCPLSAGSLAGHRALDARGQERRRGEGPALLPLRALVRALRAPAAVHCPRLPGGGEARVALEAEGSTGANGQEPAAQRNPERKRQRRWL
jgi:hypothetical protein